MKVIAVSNQKGGVGKTSTATSLAYGLMQKGKKVLLVDCDSQSNSTDTWGARNEQGYATLADLLLADDPAEECIQHTEIGDIIAGDPILEDADKHLTGFTGFFRLKNRLKPLLPYYDHIILDTPPNLGVMLQNALIAAEGVIVPITCGRYALQGISRFTNTVADIRSQPNPDLRVLGMLLVKYDRRKILAREVESGLPGLAKTLDTEVFDTRIRLSEDVEKSQASKLPLQEYSPMATASVDYAEFIEELEKRGIV